MCDTTRWYADLIWAEEEKKLQKSKELIKKYIRAETDIYVKTMN